MRTLVRHDRRIKIIYPLIFLPISTDFFYTQHIKRETTLIQCNYRCRVAIRAHKEVERIATYVKKKKHNVRLSPLSCDGCETLFQPKLKLA